MSKIPYPFESIPTYFRENGWFDPKKNGSHFKMIAFITWCFSRCRSFSRKILHDNTEINLEPFEFVFGSSTCSNETGLTEKEIRGRTELLEKSNLLKKTANSRANRFTCYKWVTEAFLNNEGGLKGGLVQKSDQNEGRTEGRTEGHQTRYKIVDNNVVVAEKIGNGVEVMNNDQITKDDVYYFCLKSKKDWESNEIEEAWEIYSKKENINEPISYIEGIINKKRILKTQNEKKTCLKNKKNKNQKTYSNIQQNGKNSSEEKKESSSESDLKMLRLPV